MSKRATWDATGKVLVLSFPFDRELNQQIRQLGGQFDWISKSWRFFGPSASAAIPQLEALGFTCPSTSGPRATPAPARRPPASAPQAAPPRPHVRPSPPASRRPSAQPATAQSWSVSTLNAQVQRALESGLPREIWVVGKVSGAGRLRRDGHAYFNLVEEDHRGDTRASISVALFRDARRRIERQLARRELKLEDGLQLRVRGHVNLYAARGSLSFIIEDIDAAYSEGALALKREEVLRQLRAEGLLTRNKALTTPTIPLRIALLTSAESDAYHDAVKTLRSSGYSFRVSVFDVRVQGAQLASTVIPALRRVADYASAFDVCLITRGGGSRVELAAWDDIDVARAVATLPLKVVVGIGHEQDLSALDAIAHSEKTPTAAAQHLVGLLDTASRELADLAVRLDTGPRARWREATTRLAQVGQALLNATTRAMHGSRLEVDARLPAALRASVLGRLDSHRRELTRATLTLQSARATNALRRSEHELERLGWQLERHAARTLERAQAALSASASSLHAAAPSRLRAALRDLTHLEAGVRLRDPRRVLERGYALVRDADGRVVTHAATLSRGDALSLELVDGRVAATVDAPPLTPQDP